MRNCDFEGCSRPNHARGWCRPHANQLKRGEELHDVVVPVPSTFRDADGLKPCRRCGEHKEESEFGKRNDAKDGLEYSCHRCIRSKHLKANYGLTQDEYDAKLEEQGHACYTCGATEPGHWGTFCIDHDHGCCPSFKSCGGCVRKLLCFGCNSVLGFVNDNPVRLRRLADYLEEFK